MRIAGYPVAILVGAAMAWGLRHPAAEATTREAPGRKVGDAMVSAVDLPRGQRTAGAGVRTNDRAAAYQEAWDLLAARNLPWNEKMELQCQLLAEWAEVDLEGALTAAATAKLPWQLASKERGEGFFRAFRAKMISQPDLFVPYLKDHGLGLATADLRNYWIATLGKNAPDLLASYLDELPANSAQRAVSACLSSLRDDPAKAQLFLGRLGALPDTPANRLLWAAAAPLAALKETSDLITRLNGETEAGEKWILVKALGTRLGMTEADPNKLQALLEQLPADVRRDAVLTAITPQFYTPDTTRAAFEVVVRMGDWQMVQENIVDRVGAMASREGQEQKFYDWAQSLPERDETAGLYQQALQGYLSRDPAASRQWIEELPEGWKRENALAGYVAASLAKKNDAGADWAYQLISDEKVRAGVDKGRKDSRAGKGR